MSKDKLQTLEYNMADLFDDSVKGKLQTLEDSIAELIDDDNRRYSLPEGMEVRIDEYNQYRSVDKAEHTRLITEYLSFLEDVMADPRTGKIDIVATYQQGNEVEIDRFTINDNPPNDDGTIDTDVTTRTVTLYGEGEPLEETLRNLNTRMDHFMDYTLRTLE